MDDSDQECVPAFRFDLLPRRRSSLRDRSLREDREERPRSRLNFKHIRVAQQEIGLLGNLSLAVQDGRERAEKRGNFPPSLALRSENKQRRTFSLYPTRHSARSLES